MKTKAQISPLQSEAISRRGFLGNAAAITTFMVLEPGVLGRAGEASPNRKLNIAGIGIGGQGGWDLEQISSTENIVALCDVDADHAAKTFNKYPDAKRYKDFREMLDKEKSIDAVVVATPDHAHAIVSATAMKMGKHVYCEKPLTRTVYEARTVARIARETKVATQMGNQGMAFDGNRQIKEWRDLWLGPAPLRPYHPAYVPFRWRGWWDFGSGGLGDMGIHNLAPVFSALNLGAPESVHASSTCVFKETVPLAALVHYQFPARGNLPPVKLHWYDGGLLPARPEELEEDERNLDPEDGIIFVGDDGKMLVTGWGGREPRLIPESRNQVYKRPTPTLPRSVGHHKEWIEACKGGPAPLSNFGFAGPLTEAVLLGALCIRNGGEKLLWDSANMKITNLPEANKLLHYEYRKDWKLE